MAAGANVMAGRSRSKDGVASLAYVPAIHVLLQGVSAKTWMPAFAGMTLNGPEMLRVDAAPPAAVSRSAARA